MNLPEAFENRMKLQLGESNFKLFSDSLQTHAPTSIRINPYKFKSTLKLNPVLWSNLGFYLNNRPNFSADPLWHAGYYYVQEAGSMLIEKAIQAIKKEIQTPISVLDLCASPGGKSTHIASLLGEHDVLVANEVIQSRVSTLHENLTKFAFPNIAITNSDSVDFVKSNLLFDVVLVDAPCSGEGLFRKDKSAMNEWSLENVKTCELRQKRILENAIQCILPGGFIIYSTCTYNPGENDKQVDYLIENGFELFNYELNGLPANKTQFSPHLNASEGFFMALLRKTNSNETKTPKTSISKIAPIKVNSEITELLNSPFNFFSFKSEILALKPELYEFYVSGLSNLHLYSIGLSIGKMKEKLFLPSDKLAFSHHINQDNFHLKNLDHQEALLYLNKHAIPVNSKDKSYVLLQFNNHNIGLGKYAGNRINNLFPNEWKLRKMPSQEELFSLLDSL